MQHVLGACEFTELYNAESHFSGVLVRGSGDSCPAAVPWEGVHLLRSKSCSDTFWWMRCTASSCHGHTGLRIKQQRGILGRRVGPRSPAIQDSSGQAPLHKSAPRHLHWHVSAYSPKEGKPSQSCFV